MAGSGGANGGEIKARLLLDSDQFTRNMNKAKNDLDDTTKKSDKSKQAIESLGKGATIAGASIVGGIAAAVKTAADFEQQLSKVKAVTGASTADMQLMKDKALELGAATVFSSSQAAEAMTSLGMAGFSTQQIIDAMPATLNLAGAGALDLGQAAEITANMLSTFSLKASDAAHVSDVLAKAANSTNVDVGDLAETMKYVGPVAAGMKMPIEEVAGAAALLSNYGIKGSEAGTALRAALLSMAAPSKAVAKEMASVGLNVMDAHNNMLPLPQVIDKVNQATKGMTETQKTAFASQLVGREAAASFIALMKEGGPAIAKMTGELKNSQGAAQKMSDIMNDNLKGSINQLMGSVEMAGIKLGDAFIPAIRGAADALTQFVNWLSKLDMESVQKFIVIAGAAVGIAATGAAVVKLATAVRLLFIGMGPVGWIITGLSILGGVIAGAAMEQTKATEVNLDAAKAMQDHANAVDKDVKRFEELKNKNKLSNDEMLRFLDIQSKMKANTDPAVLKRLSDEADKLQKNSGLTNEQFHEYLGLNDRIKKEVPDATVKISAQGNAWLNSLDSIKKYTAEQRAALRQELEIQRIKVENNAKDTNSKLLAEIDGQVKAQQKIVQAHKDELKYKDLIKQADDALAKKQIDISTYFNLINGPAGYQTMLDKQRGVVNGATAEWEQHKKTADQIRGQIKANETVYDQMILLELTEVGITAKKGEEVQKINEAKVALEKQITAAETLAKKDGVIDDTERQKLGKMYEQSALYDTAVGKINDIKGAQKTVTDEMNNGVASADKFNKEAGKGVTKDVTVTVDPGGVAQARIDNLAKPREVHFNIFQNITQTMKRIQDGTFFNQYKTPGGSRHMGGTVHELPKFHTGGSPAFLPSPTAPSANEVDVRLLRNEMVLTEAQQANLFQMIRTFSANAQQPSGDHTEQTRDGTVIQIGQLVVREEADVKKIAEELDRLDKQTKRSKGAR